MYQRFHLRPSAGARGDNIDKSCGQAQMNEDRECWRWCWCVCVLRGGWWGRGSQGRLELEEEKKPEEAESRWERTSGPSNKGLIDSGGFCLSPPRPTAPVMYGCFTSGRCSEGQESGSWAQVRTPGRDTAAAAAAARGRKWRLGGEQVQTREGKQEGCASTLPQHNTSAINPQH